MTERLSSLVARAGSFVLLLLLWQISVWWLSPPLLPSPQQVVDSLMFQVQGGDLLYHLGVTSARVLTSFLLALSLGVLLGILMGQFHHVDRWLDGPLTLFLNIPALVTILLCFIWIGLNEWAVILAVTLNKVPNVAVTVREGARAVDRKLLQVGKVFGLPFTRVVRQLYLPQLYPYIIAAARSGLALVWKIVLVVELMGCSEGIGFQLASFFQFFDIAGILAYAFTFAGLVYAIDSLLLRRLEQHLTRWR